MDRPEDQFDKPCPSSGLLLVANRSTGMKAPNTGEPLFSFTSISARTLISSFQVPEFLISSESSLSGPIPAQKVMTTIPKRKSNTPRNPGGIFPIGGVGIGAVEFAGSAGSIMYASEPNHKIKTTIARIAERAFNFF